MRVWPLRRLIAVPGSARGPVCLPQGFPGPVSRPDQWARPLWASALPASPDPGHTYHIPAVPSVLHATTLTAPHRPSAPDLVPRARRGCPTGSPDAVGPSVLPCCLSVPPHRQPHPGTPRLTPRAPAASLPPERSGAHPRGADTVRRGDRVEARGPAPPHTPTSTLPFTHPWPDLGRPGHWTPAPSSILQGAALQALPSCLF